MIEQLLPEADSLWQQSIPLKQFQVFHHRQSFPMEMDKGGFAVDRAQLDFELVKQAQRLGVRFLSPAKAKLIAPPRSPANTPQKSSSPAGPSKPRSDLSAPEQSARGCHVQTIINGAAHVIQSKSVIIASGLGNRVAGPYSQFHAQPTENSRVGVEAVYDSFPDQYRPGVLSMAIGDGGYVGLTHIGDHRLHVAAAVDRKSLQKHGPQDTVAALMRQSGAPVLDQTDVVWRGTPALTAKAGSIAQDRIFLIGDAAGYVEPFTGEGIRWALESGIGVAPFVVDAVGDYDPQIESDYQKWYQQTIVKQQRLCRRLSAGLKRPVLRWAAHQALRWRPTLADAIIRRINS